MDVPFAFFLLHKRYEDARLKKLLSTNSDRDSGYQSQEKSDLEIVSKEVTTENPEKFQHLFQDENMDLNSRSFVTSTPKKHVELSEFLCFNGNDNVGSVVEIFIPETMEISDEDEYQIILSDDTEENVVEMVQQKSEDRKNNSLSQQRNIRMEEDEDSQSEVERPRKNVVEVDDDEDSESSSDDYKRSNVTKVVKRRERVSDSEKESSSSSAEIEIQQPIKSVLVKAKVKSIQNCAVCKKSTNEKRDCFNPVKEAQIKNLRKASEGRGDNRFDHLDESDNIALHRKCYMGYINVRAVAKFKREQEEKNNKSSMRSTRSSTSKDLTPIQPLVEHTLKYLKMKGGDVRLSEVTIRKFKGFKQKLNDRLHRELCKKLKEIPGVTVNKDRENIHDPILRYKNKK